MVFSVQRTQKHRPPDAPVRMADFTYLRYFFSFLRHASFLTMLFFYGACGARGNGSPDGQRWPLPMDNRNIICKALPAFTVGSFRERERWEGNGRQRRATKPHSSDETRKHTFLTLPPFLLSHVVNEHSLCELTHTMAAAIIFKRNFVGYV